MDLLPEELDSFDAAGYGYDPLDPLLTDEELLEQVTADCDLPPASITIEGDLDL